jgi:hypothetical protein
MGAVTADQQGMNPGAAAGIVVGVLGKLYLHSELEPVTNLPQLSSA